MELYTNTDDSYEVDQDHSVELGEDNHVKKAASPIFKIGQIIKPIKDR